MAPKMTKNVAEKIIEIHLDVLKKDSIKEYSAKISPELNDELKGMTLEFCQEFMDNIIKDNTEMEEHQLIEVVETIMASQLEQRAIIAYEDASWKEKTSKLIPDAMLEKGYTLIHDSNYSKLFAKSNGDVVKYDNNDSMNKMHMQSNSVFKKALDNYALGFDVKDGIDTKTASTGLVNTLNRLGYDLLVGSTTKLNPTKDEKIKLSSETVIGYKIIKSVNDGGMSSAIIFVTITKYVGQKDVPNIITYIQVDHEEALAIRKAFNEPEKTFKKGEN